MVSKTPIILPTSPQCNKGRDHLHRIPLPLVALTLHLIPHMLQPLRNIHTQILVEIRAQVRKEDQQHSKRNSRIEHISEALEIRLLGRRARRSDDLGRNAWHGGEVSGRDASEEGGERLGGKSGGGRGRNDEGGEEGGDFVGEDGDVDCLGDGAADGADAAQHAGCEADVLGFPEERYAGEGDVVDPADDCAFVRNTEAK